METTIRHMKEGRQIHLIQADRLNQMDRLLPTPVAYDATPGGPNNHYKGLRHKAPVLGLVPQPLPNRLLPTPTASNTIQPSEERLKKLRDGETTRNVQNGGEPCNLQERVILINRGWFRTDGLLPTLTSSNGLRGGGVGVGKAHRPFMLGCPGDAGYGMLNPKWLAWLMGFPTNWTTFEPMGTRKFHKWLQQHL